MKFEKFVKSLASSGIIYDRNLPGVDRWLASPSVFMHIPDGVQSITAAGIKEMPKAIEKMIVQVGRTADAELVKAIMPVPNGGIKDCVRVFQIRGSDISINISNDDWSLIEKSDCCEILYAYNLDTNETEAKALLVKQYPTNPADDEYELVGIIFPINYDI